MVGEPGFLVTGSGRSGTGYLATVLRACGLNVGHEAWWGLEPEQTPGLDGDVSWLGCFDRGYQGPVYAQVRDPRACIPSIVANEGTHPWWVVRAQHVALDDDPWTNACRIWLTWTRAAVNRSREWWRVEDLSPGILERVFRVSGEQAEYALARVPRDVNSRAEVPPLQWPGHLTSQVLSLAKQLGYTEERV